MKLLLKLGKNFKNFKLFDTLPMILWIMSNHGLLVHMYGFYWFWNNKTSFNLLCCENTVEKYIFRTTPKRNHQHYK